MVLSPEMAAWAPHLWLIAGLVLCALELMVAGTGIGMLFAGLAGITTGIVVYFEWVEATNLFGQLAWFFGTTCLWAALLWKPMKNIRMQKSQGYSDMVGTQAIVGPAGLIPGKVAEVRWSGANMRARLADHIVEALPANADVTVVAMENGVLVVAPV